MTLQSSGPISLADIRNEWRRSGYSPTPYYMSNYYRGGPYVGGGGSRPPSNYGSIPTSGTISFANFYGTRWGE